MSSQTQSFNDGVVNIYELNEEGLILKIGPLRYQERTVGMSRFWIASQLKVQVDLIIRIPKLKEISTRDIAVINDGSQYQVKQVQYQAGINPPVMDLSLEKLIYNYDFK